MSNKPKMTKDTIPENFTLSLALVDALPVLFFGGSMILIGLLFGSPLFMIGAALRKRRKTRVGLLGEFFKGGGSRFVHGGDLS